MHTAVDLNHIGNCFSLCKDIVHAVVTLRTSVTNICNVVRGRPASGRNNSVSDLRDQLIQMDTSGMRLAEYVLNKNIRFIYIFFVPSHAKPQSIALRPYPPDP